MPNVADFKLTGAFCCAYSPTSCHITLHSAFARPEVVPSGFIGVASRLAGHDEPLGISVVAPETLADLLRFDWRNVQVRLRLTVDEDRIRGDAHGVLEALVPVQFLPWHYECELREEDIARLWPHSIHEPLERPWPVCPAESLPLGFEFPDHYLETVDFHGVSHAAMQLGAVRCNWESRRFRGNVKAEAASMLSTMMRGANHAVVDGITYLDTTRAVLRQVL